MTNLYLLYVGQANSESDALHKLDIILAKRYALRTFGGYTLFQGEGGWERNDIEENVHIWHILSASPISVFHFRDYLQAQFRQPEVFVYKVEGSLVGTHIGRQHG